MQLDCLKVFSLLLCLLACTSSNQQDNLAAVDLPEINITDVEAITDVRLSELPEKKVVRPVRVDQEWFKMFSGGFTFVKLFQIVSGGFRIV